MSNYTPPLSVTSINTSVDPCRLTTVGKIYARLPELERLCHPSLYTLFSESIIYTRDFTETVKLNNFFIHFLKSRLFICHSLRIADSSNPPFIVTSSVERNLYNIPTLILALKIGMPIRLTKNLSTNYDVAEGARLIIVSIEPDVIHARVLLLDSYGPVVRIIREPLICCDPSNPTLHYSRFQYPIQPAFASMLFRKKYDFVKIVALFKSYQLYVSADIYHWPRDEDTTNVSLSFSLIC
ncbi:hypothetical protein MJO28_008812 [Puccinia striiformis f. sp. tritici]|uniref:Uncharacterized protein n=1 Tax=Puccinia striiformis f. sp. tritici TaxID=168172 RepID=A0ACC0ED94_9BASI|nr:hypothetical protein MJO28_008812 [Puccinia striiformis f. sp. tritici]